jgi:hypothetical protein
LALVLQASTSRFVPHVTVIPTEENRGWFATLEVDGDDGVVAELGYRRRQRSASSGCDGVEDDCRDFSCRGSGDAASGRSAWLGSTDGAQVRAEGRT